MKKKTKTKVKKAKTIKREVKIKHPSTCPDQHPTYKRIWKRYHPDISSRENFKPSHREKLYRICELHVIIDKVLNVLTTEGATYKTQDSQGNPIFKERPECKLYKIYMAEVRAWEKDLGVLPYKDQKLKTDKKKSPWD